MSRVSRHMRGTLAVAGVLIATGLIGGGYGVLTNTTTDSASGVGYCPAVATNTDVCYLHTETRGYPNVSTADYGTDIPRCESDDWNSTHLPRCYTERVTDGAVIIINQDDTTLATIR